MAAGAVIAAHRDHRRQIAALLADDPANYLPAVDGGWRRIFGRLQPEANAWALLAYGPDRDNAGNSAWSARTIEVFDAGMGGPAAIPHPAGDLVITSIADDPVLPGLRQFADSDLAVSLLRHRPHRRCTLRITQGGRDNVVKVLADDRGQRFDRDARELWAAAARDELGFRVAEPLRWDEATRSAWQAIVPGASAAPTLLGAHGEAIAERMGVALGTLACSSAEPSITVTSDDQLRRTKRAAEHAIRRVPELATDLRRILDIFSARQAALRPDRLVPVHGAPHMHQWLIDDDHRLGLIDFDRFALGEVELDVATLLVELDYEEALTQPPATIEGAVLSGYRSSGIEIDRSRLRLYTAHKRMSKVTREAWALRTNGERRARRHLSRIVEDLEW